MSIFDKFLDISPLTFKIVTNYTTKTQINPKKRVLFEGELHVKSKNHAVSTKYFKIIDRKFICSQVKNSK